MQFFESQRPSDMREKFERVGRNSHMLKAPCLRLTHRPPSFAPRQSHPNPHLSGRLSHFVQLVVYLKNGHPGLM